MTPAKSKIFLEKIEALKAILVQLDGVMGRNPSDEHFWLIDRSKLDSVINDWLDSYWQQKTHARE